MFRKPLFWILFSLASAACALFTLTNFSQAFSIVNIKLTMDRSGALKEARALFNKYGWGPAGASEAASFDLDSKLRDYTELYAGGKKAFNSLIAQGIVSPYTWGVRLYKEGEEQETTVYFTPQGKPSGFKVLLPESVAGRNVSSEAARLAAEKSASSEWGVSFSSYVLVENSSEKRLSGRVDHTFVYERPDLSIGEGRYRIRLAVSGDKLTELARYVKIPESFDLKFAKMRSANDTLALSSEVSVVILYVVGGCIFGLLFLLPKGWVNWKVPLIAGLGIAFLQLLSTFNSSPLDWMTYDTALAGRVYFFQRLVQSLQSFILDAVLLILTFIAAESLTRKAFPKHIQLWKIWSKDSAASVQVAGRTTSAYLLVSVFFAYEVALYFMTKGIHNWWSPSDTIYDPNILAAYLPWLGPFADALHAGFWEECLFRAVPLACAALIGDKLGNRKYWLLAALLFQAVVFGSAHANYPNQPYYARLVELIIPALAFGIIYLRFGLLTGMVLHFSYDAVMMSIPLFVSQAPLSGVDKTVFLLLLFIPIWVILSSRLRSGRWQELGSLFYNSSWHPLNKTKEVQASATPEKSPAEMNFIVRKSFIAAIPLGIIMVLVFSRFESDSPNLSISRVQALAKSDSEMASRGIIIPKGWKEFSRAAGVAPDTASRFVWKEGGRKNYRYLVRERYLPLPSWEVRYANFAGDISQRSEEYLVDLAGDGSLLNFSHKVPQDRPGANLEEKKALSLADNSLVSVFRTDPARLNLISSEPSKLPHRTDWIFDFQDPYRYPLKTGQARISVSIAGNEVNGETRYVYVPDQWKRADRERDAAMRALGGMCSIILNLAFLSGMAFAVFAWVKKRFSVKLFLAFSVSMAALQAAQVLNKWPQIAFSFSAAEPVFNQVLSVVGIAAIQILVSSLAIGLINGFSLYRPKNLPAPSTRFSLGIAYGWAMLFIGSLAAAQRLLPRAVAVFPKFQRSGFAVSGAGSCAPGYKVPY